MEPVIIKLNLTTGIFQIYYKTFRMVIRFSETVVSCSSLMSHNTNMNVIISMFAAQVRDQKLLEI